MKIISILFLLLLFAFQCGCSFQHPYALKDTSFIQNKKTGAVVISVRCPFYGTIPPRPTYSIGRIEDGKHFTIVAGRSKSAKNFSPGLSKGTGFVDTLEFPAGEYEIYRWELWYNLGTFGQWTETPGKIFSIPFRVEAGKLNYLGEIALASYRFEFKDMHERDLTIVYKEHPDLKNAELVYHPLECRLGCDSAPKVGPKTIPITPPPVQPR